MKNLAIFYRDRDNQRAINYIEDNFYKILGDYVNITNYYTNEFSPNYKINADAYIVCYEEMLNDLVGHIDNFSKVIVITRSIQQKYLKPIMDIPAGTKVLIVNDSRESTLQTMYMIFELGIGHLSLFPFEKDIYEAGGYDDFDTAIVTIDSEELVPEHIPNVYNIHNREVSFETFHKVISLLDLKSEHVYNNLIEKIKEDMDTGTNYINSYLSNILKDRMISNVVDESSRAIILLDSADNIHYINETAYNIFNLSQEEKFIQSEFLPKKLADTASFDGELVFLNGSNYLTEKIDICLVNNSIGCCLIFQNERDLRKDENNLSRHLKQTGFYAEHQFSDIVSTSYQMHQCINTAKKVAPSNYTILISGESGTGKELLAQSIHNYSQRKNYPFVAVNCAAIPEALLESELFGYDEGSFTGAKKNGKLGLFEHAQHGTIFLDEIGDISPTLQASLLRVLQEKQIMRIGSGKIININTRIIAATNANLEKKVAEGKFRSDLFYRLNVISLNIAPLRERKDDIMPLLCGFLGKHYNNLLPSEKNILLKHSWPGNVRELENVASYYKILNKLPDYLCKEANHAPDAISNTSAIYENFADINLSMSEDDIRIHILKAVASCSTPFSGAGRKVISQKLSEKGVNIGEGILKKQMAFLKAQGLIDSGAGRAGSHITQKGIDFIKAKGEA